MLSFRFGPEDVANVRFAISPLMEHVRSLTGDAVTGELRDATTSGTVVA
jgi:hypothetical protein